MAYIVIKGDELYHHGVKGMRWGVRRYQNKDGSLTSAGRKRYTDYKPAIKEYRDSYDKASSMNDAADAKWRDVQAARKELGRTAIGRTIASARNKTEAAKKYNRMYDEWSKMQDDADEQWRDADEKYKHTGGNRLTRIANNIRYDTKLGSAKSGEKKQLTDEERAARNAKIKKAAVAVGVTALVAAGTYAAVKYNNKTMAEAKQIMSDAHKKKIDEYLEQADKTFQQQNFAASMYRQFDRVHQGNTEEAKAWARAEGEYRTKLNNVLKEKNIYNNAARRHMADKAVQRQAQKEIIKRDIKDTKAKVYSKYREAKGDLPQNVGWYMDRTNKKATKNIANLLNETAYEKELRKKADSIAEYIKRKS